jgi:hypothetical protein
VNGLRTVADALGPIENALRDGGVARRELSRTGVVAAVYPIVESRVSEVLRAELAVDLGEVVVSAWTRYRALVDAGRRTRDAPGAPEDVVLAEHTVTSDHHPTVDVLVDGQVVASLTFDVEVSLTVRAAVAVVQAGRLTAVRAGDVEVAATLGLHGAELCRRSAQVLVGHLVRLGSGAPLVTAASGTGAAAAPSPWWQRT